MRVGDNVSVRKNIKRFEADTSRRSSLSHIDGTHARDRKARIARHIIRCSKANPESIVLVVGRAGGRKRASEIPSSDRHHRLRPQRATTPRAPPLPPPPLFTRHSQITIHVQIRSLASPLIRTLSFCLQRREDKSACMGWHHLAGCWPVAVGRRREGMQSRVKDSSGDRISDGNE